jgi:hypothetical protein
MATREGSTWVRRPFPRTAADGAGSTAAAALIAGRLITLSPNRLELSHDALLEHWPRLRGWLADRAAAVDLLEHLGAATLASVATGRSASDLTRVRGYRQPEHQEDISAEES